MNKSQRNIIVSLLRNHKRVTLRMLFDSGCGYTGRNRIAELRREGWHIEHYNHDPHKGEVVSDNAYILIGEPTEFKTESNGQLTFA